MYEFTNDFQCTLTTPIDFNSIIKIICSPLSTVLKEPKKVIFHDPATIVYWPDETKTVVKCGEDDIYDKEKGLALCYMKKILGNKGNFNEVLKKWCEEKEEPKKEIHHWIKGKEFLKCSNCGFDALFPVKKCPKCGSGMKVNWEEG